MRRHIIVSLATLLIATTFAPIASAEIVAMWHFDEIGGATALASVGGVDGQLAGDAAFVSGGISGNAISVSVAGNGLVNMGDNFGFDSGDFSVVSWVKTAAGDRSDDYLFVSKHRATFVAGYILGVNANGDYGQTDKAWFYDSNGNPGDDPRSQTSVNDGAWHQVVGVYHAAGMAEIYVDGAGVEDSKVADDLEPINAPLLVGGLDFAGTPRGTFNGLVDEIQLYDHALSAGDVQYLFENPANAVPEPSTMALLISGALGLLLLAQRRRR